VPRFEVFSHKARRADWRSVIGHFLSPNGPLQLCLNLNDVRSTPSIASAICPAGRRIMPSANPTYVLVKWSGWLPRAKSVLHEPGLAIIKSIDEIYRLLCNPVVYDFRQSLLAQGRDLAEKIVRPIR
jgi:hypothetical protein